MSAPDSASLIWDFFHTGGPYCVSPSYSLNCTMINYYINYWRKCVLSVVMTNWISYGHSLVNWVWTGKIRIKHIICDHDAQTGSYFCTDFISPQSLNLGGRRGTIDDVATIHFHTSLSSAALRKSPNPIPVHFLMLSFHLVFCLPLRLAPFTVPCRIVFAMPEDLVLHPLLLPEFPFLYHD